MPNNKPSVIKLSKYLLPEHKEVTKGNYVLWGPKHSVPRELLAALDKSSIHSSITTSYAQQFAGHGFIKEDANGKVDTILTQALSIANRQGESFDAVLAKAAYDLAVFGGFALVVHWNVTREKLVEIYHMDFSSIASGLMDENNDVQFYYHSLDWSKHEPLTTPIKAFSPESADGRKEARQIIVYKNHWGGKNYYPRPHYYSALPWIEIDHQLSQYKVNGLKNRFSAGMVVSFNNGLPTEDEREAVTEMLKENFTGNDNAESIVVDFAEDKEHAVTLNPIPTNDAANSFGNMMQEKDNEICAAHKITSKLLVGLQSGNGFSSNADEIKNAYELFFRYQVQPQQKVLEEKFTMILKHFGHDYNLKINTATPFEIKSQGKAETVLNAINSLSPLVANKVLESMTEDEIRALISLGAKITPPTGGTASTPPADDKINPDNNA